MNVEWQQLIGSSFVSFMLSYMLMKSWLPFAPKRTGQVLLQVQLTLLQRLLIYRTQAILLLIYIILGSLPGYTSGWFIPGTQAVAVAGIFIIVSLPLRYVFTDRGVALNNGVPRLYRGFRRFDVRPGKRWLQNNVTIILRGKRQERGTVPSHVLYIPRSAQNDVVRLLKRHIR